MRQLKKVLPLGHAIRFSILIIFVFASIIVHATEILLADAIQKGLVSAVFCGKLNDGTSHSSSSYFGPCLNVNLQSTVKTTLNLRFEAGRFLESADTSEQRMMISRDEMIVLLPFKKKSLSIYAICTQMHDHSPGEESLLTLGPMAEGNLLALAQFLSKNNFQGLAAQEAVWAITDNNDPGSIFSDHADEMDKLLSLVCKLTGKLPPPAPHRIFYASGMVSGEIVFENKQRETYFFLMRDEEGKDIGTFFENKTITNPMVITLTWRFRFNGFAKGVYYVSLLNAKKEVVASRPVVIE